MTELAPAVRSASIDEGLVLRYLDLDPDKVETQALLAICRRYDLDPVLKHVVLISDHNSSRANPYITRDGLLHIAHQSGRFDGMECHSSSFEDAGEGRGEWVAVVSVWRNDMSRPFTYEGRHPSHRRKSHQNGGGWYQVQNGRDMAIKTAEVAALKRAFDVSGMPSADEPTTTGGTNHPENVAEAVTAAALATPAASSPSKETSNPIPMSPGELAAVIDRLPDDRSEKLFNWVGTITDAAGEPIDIAGLSQRDLEGLDDALLALIGEQARRALDIDEHITEADIIDDTAEEPF